MSIVLSSEASESSFTADSFLSKLPHAHDGIAASFRHHLACTNDPKVATIFIGGMMIGELIVSTAQS
jgi:hypothetical protein